MIVRGLPRINASAQKQMFLGRLIPGLPHEWIQPIVSPHVSCNDGMMGRIAVPLPYIRHMLFRIDPEAMVLL